VTTTLWLRIASAISLILLWQLASMAKSEPARVRPMIAVIALATVGSGVIAWRFIFPIPVLFSAVLAVVLGLAYVTTWQQKPSSTAVGKTSVRV
jgi:hypothetical protein